MPETQRVLLSQPLPELKRPLARLQPVLAKKGTPSINIDQVRKALHGIAILEPTLVVESPWHWQEAILSLDEHIDAILPFSVPAYPTEVWNSHPQPLVERQLPVIFWPLLPYDEPDFWRWSARDFLQALGVTVYIAEDTDHALKLVKAYAVKRFLRHSRMVVFGEQNFPWNAHAAGHLVEENLGTRIMVRSITDIRSRYDSISDEQVAAVWQERQERYSVKSVRSRELDQAIRVYLAIKRVLQEEKAAAFGVNCFGDLIIKGGRDVPCLAQLMLREDGYVTACDGDFAAMMSMMLITHMLDKPCMMSNMYPVSYIGALKDHFGDPLAPDESVYPRDRWPNLARLAHCGFVGIVSPEMTPQNKATLTDWGGTYEIKRDGSGCGVDSDMIANEPVTVVELCFDAHTLLLAQAKICETTRHESMPHCESSVLMEFRDLPDFVRNISREHTAIVYGDHIQELEVLGNVLGLNVKIF
ncbi:hypothetical protein GF406_14315 [candidate division KSB1 bacterium]|nr:hypothetical protein [candidate division KSB1 bacterium]